MTSTIVICETGPTGRAVSFAAPSQVIEAWSPAECGPAFQAMQIAREAGKWLAGYASYELGYVLEPKLARLLPQSRRCPLLQFGTFDAPEDAAAFLEKAGEDAAGASLHDLRPGWTPERYRNAFEQLISQIRAGDLYQANLTMPLHMRRRGSVAGLFGALAAHQPVQYGALVDLGGPTILSRSPELFVEISSDRRIRARPMKGTMPRGETPSQDEALRNRLATDVKNRAENLMIVDLLRNDLARISEVGSVHVPELFRIETYSTVHQMVSPIESRLLEGLSLRDLFEGLFPCGSITGAPKIAAMQAIRALEDTPREAYCGAIGWFAPDGSACLSVAIRALILHEGDEVVLNVGGGIVADSTAEGEYQEALWKARFATALLND